MSQLITIEKSVLDDILEQLSVLRGKVLALKKTETRPETITKKKIRYGSEEWWDTSTKKALKQVKEGKVYEAKNLKDAIRWLNS